MCCSFIVFLQYLRVVVWLVGQGLLPEQSGNMRSVIIILLSLLVSSHELYSKLIQ